MKKRWIIIGAVILILITVIIGIYLIYYSNECSINNIKACNIDCNVDNDCKRDGLCGCININENMKNPFNLMADCRQFVCKCINNKCSPQ